MIFQIFMFSKNFGDHYCDKNNAQVHRGFCKLLSLQLYNYMASCLMSKSIACQYQEMQLLI